MEGHMEEMYVVLGTVVMAWGVAALCSMVAIKW